MATKLRLGIELRDNKIRDLSYRPSYTLRDHSYIDTTDYGQQGTPLSVPDTNHALIRVYPNPSSGFTNLELQSIPEGNYKVKIFSASGILLLEHDINIETTCDITKRINIENLASGSYHLLLSLGTKVLGSYKIIIIH